MAGPSFPLWPFRPNWSGVVTETLSWMTDVLSSVEGDEQRRILREYPRKMIEYVSLLHQRERALQDNLLTAYGVHDWMLPLWADEHHIESTVTAGSSLILFETAGYGEFRKNGWIVLMSNRGVNYEVCQISELKSNSIRTVDPLQKTWDSETRVFPLQRARFTDQPQLVRKSDAVISGSYRFLITEPDIRSYGTRQRKGFYLITDGLMSRQLAIRQDSSAFNPDAGLTVGQANMIRACFLAQDTLGVGQTLASLVAADFYRELAFTMLDAVVDGGRDNAAIVRRPITSETQRITLPHWLYAARGSVGSLAGIGEAYEMIPTLDIVAPSFASAAPESFRDFDVALTRAIQLESREAARTRWSYLRDAFRITNLRGRRQDNGQPFMPGSHPFRLSGSPQGFAGFRGSPASVWQTVDLWSAYSGRSDGIMGDLPANSLFITDGSTGVTAAPISPRNSQNYLKPSEVLLGEQNIRLLIEAQKAYRKHGGDLGPLTPLYVINNQDTAFHGTADTWTYSIPNGEQSTFEQLYAIEGVSKMVLETEVYGSDLVFEGKDVVVSNRPVYYVAGGTDSKIGRDESYAWLDTVNFGRSVVRNFMKWFNDNWSYFVDLVNNQDTLVFNGDLIKVYLDASQTALANPVARLSDPRLGRALEYDAAPSTAALALRTSLQMLASNEPLPTLYRTVLIKAWNHLEQCWQRSGPLGNTWAVERDNVYWHQSEIVLTLATMLEHKKYLPSEISTLLIEQRLVSFSKWLKGEGSSAGEATLIIGLRDQYKGYSVLTIPPNEVQNNTIDVVRLTDQFETNIAIPLQSDYDPTAFNRTQYSWWNHGRKGNEEFRTILYSLRGRAVPFWFPTHMIDFLLIQPILLSATLTVQNVGYTASGGPRNGRRHITILLVDGTRFYREIVGSVELSEDQEILLMDAPFRRIVRIDDVQRISFMDLVRLDQDGIQIGHQTDQEGISTSTTVFRSLKID